MEKFLLTVLGNDNDHKSRLIESGVFTYIYYLEFAILESISTLFIKVIEFGHKILIGSVDWHTCGILIDKVYAQVFNMIPRFIIELTKYGS